MSKKHSNTANFQVPVALLLMGMAAASVLPLAAYGDQTAVNRTIETVGTVTDNGAAHYNVTSQTMTPPDNWLFIQPATKASVSPTGQAADLIHNTEDSVLAAWAVDQNVSTADVFEGSVGGTLKLAKPPPSGRARAVVLPTWAAKVSTEMAVITLSSSTFKRAPDGTTDARRKVGVFEGVKVDVDSILNRSGSEVSGIDSASLTWDIDEPDLGSSETPSRLYYATGAHTIFVAGSRPGSVVLTVKYITQGSAVLAAGTIKFEIVQPQGMIAKTVIAEPKWTGVAGFAGQQARFNDLEITPKDVFFGDMHFTEGIADPVPTGYFSWYHTHVENLPKHDEDHGAYAIDWLLDGQTGTFPGFSDQAGGGAYPPNISTTNPPTWSLGTFTWNIPFYYSKLPFPLDALSRPDSTKVVSPAYKTCTDDNIQTQEITEENGTTVIKKLSRTSPPRIP